MTTTPPDEPQPYGATPPPPSGYEAVPPSPATPPTTPPAYGSTPPPAPAYTPPPAGGYTPPPGGYAPPPPAYGVGASGPLLSDSDQRLWATLAHIGGLLLSFIAPLVIWLVYKGRGQFVEEQAKEALNFQITLAIAGIAISIITAITLGLGAILYLAFIAALVFMIMGAIAANKGEAYRYPVNIRLIK